MNSHSKSAYPNHSFPQNWSVLDLADAVPLRLSERVSPGLVEFTAPTAANSRFAAPTTRNRRRRGYLSSAQLPAFVRVR